MPTSRGCWSAWGKRAMPPKSVIRQSDLTPASREAIGLDALRKRIQTVEPPRDLR